MSLATGHYQLSAAFKTLQVHWDQTCLSLRDAVRRESTCATGRTWSGACRRCCRRSTGWNRCWGRCGRTAAERDEGTTR